MGPETAPLVGGKPRFLGLVILVLLVLRWWLGTLPGYPHDLGAYKEWALRGGTRGIETLYDEGSTYDYPPLYGYLLAPSGRIYAWIHPAYAEAYLDREARRSLPYSGAFSLLVKIPPLAFDILLAGLLGILTFRCGVWRRERTWLGWAPALLYLAHPAVLFLSGYWGQPDAIETFLILLSLTLILLRRPELGWIAAALACLMKPVAAPYLPLLAMATLLRSGWRRLLTGGLAGAAVGVAGFLPFLVTGRGEMVFAKFFADIDIMPFTSVNAHNLWWLLGAWRPANEPWLGPLTPKVVGLLLFALAYLTILGWLWRSEARRRTGGDAATRLEGDAPWFLAAAAIGFSFFTLSTHMHENHLFPVLPFLLLMAGRGRRWAWIFVIAGLSILVNMVTHDIIIGERWLRYIGGTTNYSHPDLGRPLSGLEWVLAYGNAWVVVATYAFLMVSMLRRRGTVKPSREVRPKQPG